MKKLFYTVLVLIITYNGVNAQTGKTSDTDSSLFFKNFKYVEIGGASFIGTSFNYERHLSEKPSGFSMRVGLGGGFVPSLFSDDIQLFGVLAAGLYYKMSVSASNTHFIELGSTYSYIFSKGDFNASIMSGSVAWRYEPQKSKLLLKAVFMPVVYSVTDNQVLGIPWFGFTIGSRF